LAETEPLLGEEDDMPIGGCDVCITAGLEQTRGDFETWVDHTWRLKLPKSFDVEDLRKAHRDCEILGEKLRSDPKEIAAVMNELRQNKIVDAKQRIKRLGLTERDFANQDGGLAWLLIVAVLLYATDAY
jgi:hypothetical protein